MQFGRIDANAYTLDFQYPLTAIQVPFCYFYYCTARGQFNLGLALLGFNTPIGSVFSLTMYLCCDWLYLQNKESFPLLQAYMTFFSRDSIHLLQAFSVALANVTQRLKWTISSSPTFLPLPLPLPRTFFSQSCFLPFNNPVSPQGQSCFFPRAIQIPISSL